MTDSPAAGNAASGIPEQAVTAAAEYLHDDECNDGDTQTCGRWRCGSDPENRFHSPHARHIEYYRDRARAILAAAAPLILTEQRKWDAAAHKAVQRARQHITEAARTGSVTAILTAVREGLDDIDQTIPEVTDG